MTTSVSIVELEIISWTPVLKNKPQLLLRVTVLRKLLLLLQL